MPTMDDINRLEAKGLARAKIRSKRRRIQMIRRRTIRGSLALFALAWAIVFGQLATGNDPALSRAHRTRKAHTSSHRGPPPSRRPGGESSQLAAPAPHHAEPESGEEAAPAKEAKPSEGAAPREAVTHGPASAPTPPVVTSAS
jgi:hypothetical protein